MPSKRRPRKRSRSEDAGAERGRRNPKAGEPGAPGNWPPGLFDNVADLLAHALVEDTKKNPGLYPSLWKVRADKQSVTRILAELVFLVYHEAQNVRYAINAGKLRDVSKYGKLTSLPTNRLEAWKAMAAIRTQAAGATTAAEVAGIFERHFGLTLTDLEALYRAPLWKASAYGGNRWAPICAAVRDLEEAITQGDAQRSMELLDRIPKLRHNTGTIEEKLRGLHAGRG